MTDINEIKNTALKQAEEHEKAWTKYTEDEVKRNTCHECAELLAEVERLQNNNKELQDELEATRKRENSLLQSCTDAIKQLHQRDQLQAANDVLVDALEGIEWSTGSNTASILPAIKRRAQEALSTTPPQAYERLKALEEVAEKAKITVRDVDLRYEDSNNTLYKLEEALQRLEEVSK